MNKKTYLVKRLDSIFWALMLIWWGLRWSVLAFLPNGSGLLGTSLLLLGANLALRSARVPTNPDNTFFGLLTLLSGGVLVITSVMHISANLPAFETIMIVLGVLILGYTFLRPDRRTTSQP